MTIDVTRPLITMVMVLSDAYLLEGEEQVGVVASTEKVELRLIRIVTIDQGLLNISSL